jgi:nitroreductase
MELKEVIETRRSIRKFDPDKPVEDSLLKEIIELASMAPSAHNGQPWRFIIIRNQEKKEKIAEKYKRASNFLIHTPVVIAVVANFNDIRKAGEDSEKAVKYYCVQDTAAAIENLLLSAWNFGLGTCWIGDFDESLLRELLNIPEGCNAVALIAVGYPSPENIFQFHIENQLMKYYPMKSFSELKQ